MDSNNPYTTPQSEPAAIIGGDQQFMNMDFRQFKKLYHRSCNVNAITFLLVLGLIGLVIMSMAIGGESGSNRLLIIGLTAFYGVAVAGLFQRTNWGRILGIIVCIISLISIPIGTLIGIFGLAAFFGAPQLFGKERVTHKVLKAEFKLRKAAQRGR